MNSTPAFPSFAKAVLLCAAVVVFQMMLVVPLTLAEAVAAQVWPNAPLHLTAHPLTLGIVSLVALGLVLVWGAAWARAPRRELFPLVPFRPVLLMPILLTVAGGVIVLSEVDNLFRLLFPVPSWLHDLFRSLIEADRHWVSATFAFVIVAPATEELLFRGLILRGFLTRYRVGLALGQSAVLFALTHVNPWQYCSAMAAGVVFAWWRVRTGSLWPGLMGHALLNAMVVFHRWLPARIPGFNEGDPLGQMQLQPLWFDAVGLVTAAAGLWLFGRLQPSPPPPPLPRVPVPPVIADGGAAG